MFISSRAIYSLRPSVPVPSIWSSRMGVLHHTPSTFKTFAEVARLIKPGGRFYLWLYRKRGGWVRRHLLSPAVDLTRMIVSRIPRAPQALIVKVYAFTLGGWHRLLRKGNDPRAATLGMNFGGAALITKRYWK